jgi:hypothetical protein
VGILSFRGHADSAPASSLLQKKLSPQIRLKDIRPMNFIRRWRHGAERHQEQLLVKLWTINTLDADEHTQTAQLTPKLALAAKHELKSSLKYLSASEVEFTIQQTVSEKAYHHDVVSNLRRQLSHSRK